MNEVYTDLEDVDKTYLSLLKRVEDMEKRDKTGLSFVDIMKPYSDLYHWCANKGYIKNELNEKDNTVV